MFQRLNVIYECQNTFFFFIHFTNLKSCYSIVTQKVVGTVDKNKLWFLFDKIVQNYNAALVFILNQFMF